MIKAAQLAPFQLQGVTGPLVDARKSSATLLTTAKVKYTQPHGNDRYQFSLEQEQVLRKRLPGAEFRRPSGSLIYSISYALVYPMRYATNASECPTSVRIDEDSEIQLDFAEGRFYDRQLFSIQNPPGHEKSSGCCSQVIMLKVDRYPPTWRCPAVLYRTVGLSGRQSSH